MPGTIINALGYTEDERGVRDNATNSKEQSKKWGLQEKEWQLK